VYIYNYCKNKREVSPTMKELIRKKTAEEKFHEIIHDVLTHTDEESLDQPPIVPSDIVIELVEDDDPRLPGI